MRRDDTTTAEAQNAYRGKHSAGSGQWSYPLMRRTTGRVSQIRAGTDYLACSCGWRLVEVARRQSSKAKAARLHSQHLAEVAGCSR